MSLLRLARVHIAKMKSLAWEIELTGPPSWEILVVPRLHSVYLADQFDIGTTARLKLRRYDITSGQKLAEFPMRACVNAVCFSSDYSTLLANSDRRIYLLCSKTLKELHRWESRVPSGMTSIVQIGRDVAMKDRIDRNVCLYNLDTMKVRRMSLGIGRPLFRDVVDSTFLACCELDGRVLRVDPAAKKYAALFEGPPFNFCSVDYKSKTLWLGEGLPGAFEDISGKTAPTVNNRVHSVSLEGKAVKQFDLGFKFHALSVSEGAQFIWIRTESENDTQEIRILSTDDRLTETARLRIPNGDELMYADAQTGLVFTSHRTVDEAGDIISTRLRCWQV